MLLTCPNCQHVVDTETAIDGILICPSCFRTLMAQYDIQRDVTTIALATGRHIDQLNTEQLAALRRQRAALRKAAKA